MTKASDIETVARQLASHFLLEPDWRSRLGGSVATLQRIDPQSFAGGAYAPETVQTIIDRTAEILFHIALSDPLTVARLYFDLLPRLPNHPLTSSVITALSDGRAVLELLRRHGAEFQIRRDDTGASFITVHGMDRVRGMDDSFKGAIRTAMDWADAVGPHAQGGLHWIH